MSEMLRAELRMQLVILEREMKRIDAWEAYPPSADRLASAIPFCHDTLEFTQWVQWIFLPRFHAVLEGGHSLPGASAIVPVAELALEKSEADNDALLDAFREIDRLLNSQ